MQIPRVLDRADHVVAAVKATLLDTLPLQRLHRQSTRIKLVLLWKLDKDAPRYLALVMTTNPLPGPEERSLVGYFELIRSI